MQRATKYSAKISNSKISADLQAATMIELPGAELAGPDGTRTIRPGRALRIPTSDGFITASRREAALHHRFAVFSGNNAEALGMLGVMSQDELQFIVFDLGAPEIEAFLKRADEERFIRVLFQSASGDTRLLLPPHGEGLEMLVHESQTARAMHMARYACAVRDAVDYVLTSDAMAKLQLDEAAFRTVTVSCVLTESVAVRIKQFPHAPATVN